MDYKNAFSVAGMAVVIMLSALMLIACSATNNSTTMPKYLGITKSEREKFVNYTGF